MVLLDQLEALAPRRGSDSSSEGTWDRLLSSLLTEMDGVTSKDLSAQIMVVGITRELDQLDPALVRPGRFDNLVCVEAPGAEDRNLLLQSALSSLELTAGAQQEINSVAKRCAGHSRAQMLDVARRAIMIMVREAGEVESSSVGRQLRPLETWHLEAALEEVGTST